MFFHHKHRFGDHGHGHGCERGDDRRFARGDFHPGFQHGPRGHGGRMGRFFAHGDLHFVVLHLIAEKPRHGYEIIKAIEEMVGGAYSPSPGTVYPTLTMLEEQGYASIQSSEGGKKLYAITPEGKAYLDTNAGAVSALLARMRQASEDGERNGLPQIIRAVENLKMALRLKGAAGRLSDEQVRQIVETLDEATRKIEQA